MATVQTTHDRIEQRGVWADVSGSALKSFMAPLNRATLKGLAPEWRDLSAMASEANPFLDVDFVDAALPLFPQAGEPQVVTIRENGVLIGLLILGLATRFARLPVSFAMSFGHLHQFLSSPLVRTGCEAAFATGVLDWLDGAPAAVRFLRLDKQAGDSPALAAIKDSAHRRGRFLTVVGAYERATFVKSDPARLSLSGRRLREIRSKRKKLAALGRLECKRLARDADPTEWIEDFLDLEHRSWKGVWGTSLLDGEGEPAFFRTMIRRFHAAGNTHLFRLTLDGRPIAASADITAGSTVFGFKCAYDLDFRRYSPGVILLLEICARADKDPAVAMINSCADRRSDMLLRLWSGRQRIEDIALARQGLFNEALLRLASAILEARAEFDRRF